MRHVLIPRRVIGTIGRDWVDDDSAYAGGGLYDYFLDNSNQAIGVRFYLDDEIGLEQDALISQYLDDDRFLFRPEEGCVDICFAGRATERLQEGKGKLHTTQDFAGGVARFGTHVALVFEVLWPPKP